MGYIGCREYIGVQEDTESTVWYRGYVIIVCTRRQLALIKRRTVYSTIIQTKKVSATAWRVATGDWLLAGGLEGVATSTSTL